MKLEQAILVTGKTRLQQLVERFNSLEQARFYIEHSGGSFSFYREEDQAFRQSFAYLKRILGTTLPFKTLDRSFCRISSLRKTNWSLSWDRMDW